MADEFVRRDVFDVTMSRMEALIDRSLAKQEALASRMREETNSAISKMQQAMIEMRGETNNAISKMQKDISDMRGDIKAEVSGLKGDVKAMNARLDTLQNKFSWNLAWLGVIIGLVLAVVQHLWK